MRTLILADIHGNLPALEAVLSSPQAKSCNDIISLGDHVNFGPQPRQVHTRLAQLGATMLLGNHEHRLLHMDSPEFAAYNWRLLHWTHSQLKDINLRLPVDVRRGPCLFTHGTPGDPFHLIDPEEVPAQLDALPSVVTHLFSGHNHRPWMVEHNGRVACNPGSLGMLEDGEGGQAPFVIMDERDGAITLACHRVPYDTAKLKRAFITGGSAKAAPEMTRMVLHTMLTGEYQAVLKLMRFITNIARPMGLTLGHQEAWAAADRAMPWREKITTAEYWRTLEEELL